MGTRLAGKHKCQVVITRPLTLIAKTCLRDNPQPERQVANECFIRGEQDGRSNKANLCFGRELLYRLNCCRADYFCDGAAREVALQKCVVAW